MKKTIATLALLLMLRVYGEIPNGERFTGIVIPGIVYGKNNHEEFVMVKLDGNGKIFACDLDWVKSSRWVEVKESLYAPTPEEWLLHKEKRP